MWPDRWTVARGALGVAVATYLLVVLALPLAALGAGVVVRPLDAARGLLSAEALHAMWITAVLAGIALVTQVVLGVAGGIVLARQRFLGRRILDALVDLPLAVSPVMTGLAFLVLVGRGGWVPVDALGVQVAFAFPGLVLATLFVTMPFVVREVALVLEEQGDAEEQAAATLGASGWQTFWYVTLPNLRSGLEVGATLTLARALGEFGAVLVLGGAISRRTQTATTFIHAAMEERQVAAAYGMALVLGAASIALLASLRSRRVAWASG